jgi:peptide/nickel transport system substrate-binding protein
MQLHFMRPSGLTAASLVAIMTLWGAAVGSAADLKGGKLQVAILSDINDFDPQSFAAINFPVIKNLYDSLIEYTPDGKAIPSLASAWKIGPDNRSVTLTLRGDVKFQSGGTFDAEAVAATLKKAADPKTGKNVFSTMSPVKDWVVVDPHTVTLNFTDPVPDRQITDLLEFISVIDPTGMVSVETKPAGTGAYALAERKLAQSIRMTANSHYWRANEPVTTEVDLTVFSDNGSASAALESGAVDIVYGGGARDAVRLREAGYQLIQGPGPLVQVFRINTTQGAFRNQKFRQAFNYLMDRAAILRVGYAGLGEVTALPWAPASPAADPSYNARYAFSIEKARALLQASGLSQVEMSDWKLMANSDQDSVAISQLVQSTLAKAGINIQLDIKQGSEFVDALVGGKIAAVFGGIGNIQKFPTRVTTNSIYRTAKNPVLGDPHPFPAYVAAIDRVNKTFGSVADIKAAYANLNEVLMESAFGIPTNSYDVGLIVAAKNVGGIVREIDNILVARTIGFTR